MKTNSPSHTALATVLRVLVADLLVNRRKPYARTEREKANRLKLKNC